MRNQNLVISCCLVVVLLLLVGCGAAPPSREQLRNSTVIPSSTQPPVLIETPVLTEKSGQGQSSELESGPEKQKTRYQILCWEHIPLGVKATDANETVRVNLPPRFQEAVEKASARLGQDGTRYNSLFRWSDEQEREGTPEEVAAAVAEELDKTWDEEQALRLFEQGQNRQMMPHCK